MGLFRRTPVALIALAATVSLAGCGALKQDPAAGRAAPPAAPPRLQGQAARAAGAVGGLSAALRAGDVERVCRPNAVLTAAVVAEMNSSGASCEATVESMLTDFGPPRLTVLGVALEPDLATVRVRMRNGNVVPLTLLRFGAGWLVSFSDGNDPLSALNA
jgi:hypothetical protein